MDIEIYREFMVLAAHRSFVSAARDLNMSQPSLSRHMAALEKDIGRELFYETRPLSLTSAGEVVLKFSGKLIGDQANMLTEIHSLSASQSRRILILDMLHTNALYIGINEAAIQAKKEFPGLRVEFSNMDSSGLSSKQMIETEKVNISFETVITDESSSDPKLPSSMRSIWIPEFHGELVLGVSKESAWVARSSLKLSELSEARFILQANRHSERFREDFISMCSEVGFYPNITLVPSDNPLEFYATDPGDGIHLLVKVNKKYKPIIADLLKQHVTILTLSDKKRFVDAYAYMKKESGRPELDFLAHKLEEHAELFRSEI